MSPIHRCRGDLPVSRGDAQQVSGGLHHHQPVTWLEGRSQLLTHHRHAISPKGNCHSWPQVGQLLIHQVQKNTDPDARLHPAFCGPPGLVAMVGELAFFAVWIRSRTTSRVGSANQSLNGGISILHFRTPAFGGAIEPQSAGAPVTNVYVGENTIGRSHIEGIIMAPADDGAIDPDGAAVVPSACHEGVLSRRRLPCG